MKFKEIKSWQNIVKETVMTHGISAEIVAIGLLLIIEKVAQNLHMVNFAMNAEQKRKQEHVDNSLL